MKIITIHGMKIHQSMCSNRQSSVLRTAVRTCVEIVGRLWVVFRPGASNCKNIIGHFSMENHHHHCSGENVSSLQFQWKIHKKQQLAFRLQFAVPSRNEPGKATLGGDCHKSRRQFSSFSREESSFFNRKASFFNS